MITFYKETEDATTTEEIRRARRLVASTLLTTRPDRADDAPPVPGWKAWLFAAWVVIATTFYFAHMLR